MVYEPAGDDVFDAIASTFTRLTAVIRQAIKERRKKEYNDAMEKAEAAWKAGPPDVPPPPRNFSFAVAQKWLSYAFVAFCLSFIIPVLIVMAPMFARTYAHVWKVAIGIEPDCEYPARRYVAGHIDCRLPDAPAEQSDRSPVERARP